MHKKTILAGTILLLATAFLLAACGAKNAPAAPTADANAVYTQAAATVAAGLTQAAEKNPTATSTVAPPTVTPAAENANPSPTVAQPGPGNETVTATQTGDTSPQTTATTAPASGATTVPTATKATGAAPSTGDKAEWVSQNPADKTKIQKSATFTMSYILKNTGKTTWTKNYALRFYAGNQMSSPAGTNLLKEVKPGETVEITFSLIAPDSPGKTSSVWVMSTDQGVNFYSVNLELEITE